MLRARRHLTLILAVFVIGGMFGIIQIASAATDTCECYCAINGVGATRYPDADSRVSSDDCQSICRDEGYSVAACASTPDQKPQYNVLCFTPEQCSTQGGIPTASGESTQEQPGECPQGMFYCYPDPSGQAKVPLQVSIGGLKLTGDFGEYISAAYTWMLGAGTTIAIVFLMVAGLRWSFGGLSSEQITKAKHTIQNAVVGLVLLLFTYVLLFTVNPYLLRLQVPAFPMIRTVEVVGLGSCGYLRGVWGTAPYLIKNGAPYDSPYASGSDPGRPYTLANPTDGTNCGSVANVVKDWEGSDVEDQACIFDYCPDGETCVAGVGGGQCASCGDVYNTSLLSSYLSISADPSPVRDPSASTCAQFTHRSSASERASDIKFYCELDTAIYNKCVELVYPVSDDPTVSPGLDCGKLRGTVYASDNPCEAYEDVSIRYGSGVGGYYTKNVELADVDNVEVWLEVLCEDDPCGLGGLVVGKSCVFSTSTLDEGDCNSQ